MKTAALIFGLVISLTAVGYGQVRTVTNATLEKYQQKRLAAERDYRDNYEKMGFPSPEELDRQREKDMETRIALADQLRQARLEKERLELETRSVDLESRRVDLEAAQLEYSTEIDQTGGFYGGFWGGGFDGRGGFRNFRGRFPFRVWPNNRLLPMIDRGGYRATPFGIIQTPNPRSGVFFRSGGFRGRRR
ncbi:MAG TPA: hypothetical protein VNA22_06865 [Pyrinomonadaceae bacterium]|nr:hypothetical protein [Pyrinomonadaceae bacterium]